MLIRGARMLIDDKLVLGAELRAEGDRIVELGAALGERPGEPRIDAQQSDPSVPLPEVCVLRPLLDCRASETPEKIFAKFALFALVI